MRVLPPLQVLLRVLDHHDRRIHHRADSDGDAPQTTRFSRMGTGLAFQSQKNGTGLSILGSPAKSAIQINDEVGCDLIRKGTRYSPCRHCQEVAITIFVK